jgi:RNA-directed DNA polymerase
MDGHGKSDSSIVPKKPANEAELEEVKETVEGRGPAKGKALERMRQSARRDKRQRFTALLHHGYDVERLRAA